MRAQEVAPSVESSRIKSIQTQYGLNPKTDLIQRVGETPEDVMAIFREAGMSPKLHTLDVEEGHKLAAAISILPPLHQEVLKQRLRRISLLDDMPNTALTSTVNENAPYRLFDITIRAAILKQSASEWLTEKEGSCFQRNDSGISLRVDIGNITAIQYVLLHEATHVVDATLGITPSLDTNPENDKQDIATRFTSGVWEDLRTPCNMYKEADLMSIRFRPGGKIADASNMKSLYQALGRTPFVSLYGSSARTEDLAEYMTVFHLTQILNQPFRISVCHGDREVHIHDPMNSEIARSRFDLMKQFYDLTKSEQPLGN